MHGHSDRRYFLIFGALLAAFLASLGLSAIFGNPAPVVVAIFVIAAVKASIVVGWFMHLSREPRYLKVLVGSLAALLVVLFGGLAPDVVWEGTRVGPRVVAVAHAAPAGTGDPAAGAAVYQGYCVACHQADGRGMGGKLAADFVGDPTRLARSDAELLASIRDGKKGAIGQMPAWGAALSAQQQADVLAWIRASFGAK